MESLPDHPQSQVLRTAWNASSGRQSGGDAGCIGAQPAFGLPAAGQLLAIGPFLIAVLRRGFTPQAGGSLGRAAGTRLGVSPRAAGLIFETPQHLFELESAVALFGSFDGACFRESLLQAFRETTQVLLRHAELTLEVLIDRPALQLLPELLEDE